MAMAAGATLRLPAGAGGRCPLSLAASLQAVIFFHPPCRSRSAAIRVYKTAEIRNVATSHGAREDSLVYALAFVAGTSKRHGSVKEGTPHRLHPPTRSNRKYSINLFALASPSG